MKVENDNYQLGVHHINLFQSASLEEQMIAALFYFWHLQGDMDSLVCEVVTILSVEFIMHRLELLILSLFLGWMSYFSCFFPCISFLYL